MNMRQPFLVEFISGFVIVIMPSCRDDTPVLCMVVANDMLHGITAELNLHGYSNGKVNRMPLES